MTALAGDGLEFVEGAIKAPTIAAPSNEAGFGKIHADLSGELSYVDPSGNTVQLTSGGSPAGGGGGSSVGVAGTVQFSDGASGFAGDASNFFWDNTTKRLGIGTAPSSVLHVREDADAATGAQFVNEASDTNSRSFLDMVSDTAAGSLVCFSGSYTGTVLGEAAADVFAVTSAVGRPVSRMLIGTQTAAELGLNTNNVRALTIDTSQVVSLASDLITAGDCVIGEAVAGSGVAIREVGDSLQLRRGDGTTAIWPGLTAGSIRLNNAASGNAGGTWDPGTAFRLNDGTHFTFSGNSQAGVTVDVGLVRDGAGLLRVSDGAGGNGDIAPRDVLATRGVGFFGTAAPTAQPGAIADASGGATIDAEARTAINALLAVVRANGMIAT